MTEVLRTLVVHAETMAAKAGAFYPREVLAHVALAAGALAGHVRWHADRAAHGERATAALVDRARRLASGAPA
jgi:hypothetical protein